MRTILSLLTGFLLTACSPGASASPAAVVTASPDQAAAASASASPTTAPTQTLSPTPTVSPTAVPTPPFAACALPTWSGALPSGRLVDIKVVPGAAADTVVFKFEPGGDNPAAPKGSITPAKPPFTQSASGKPIPVTGDQFLQVRFQNMTLEDGSGTIYKGKHDINVTSPALREIVNYDEFEGYSGWIVGLTKPTCVTASVDKAALTVTLTVAHP